MIFPIPRAQNAATQTTTRTATHAAMALPTNTTARYSSGKEVKQILGKNQEKWEVQNELFSTAPASDGVGGLVKI